MRLGASDMHCMNDGYLFEKLQREKEGTLCVRYSSHLLMLHNLYGY